MEASQGSTTIQVEVEPVYPPLRARRKGLMPGCVSFPPVRFEPTLHPRLVPNKCLGKNLSFRWNFSDSFRIERLRVAEVSLPCPPRPSVRRFSQPNRGRKTQSFAGFDFQQALTF